MNREAKSEKGTKDLSTGESRGGGARGSELEKGAEGRAKDLPGIYCGM